MGQLKTIECSSCHEEYMYDSTEVFYDDHGYGYSTKLVKCKYCGKINIIRYFDDRAMKLNNDSRFYNYRRKSK